VPHVIWIIFLFALGACVGSFLNVIIYRLPRGESVVFPASHCPACGRAIKWYDNIPIVSWLVLRGRCRACAARISPRYLAIELAAGAIVAGLYAWYFVLSLRDGAGDFADAWPMFVAHAALLLGLLAASVVDIEQFLVPLPVMWVCAGVGVAAAAFRPHPLMPPAGPAVAVGAVAAAFGLPVGLLMVRLGWLQPSFLDAEDKPLPPPGEGAEADRPVAVTAADGVNPRREVLREVLFLGPAVLMGAVGFILAVRVPALRAGLLDIWGGPVGEHLASACGAALGMMVGIAWIWGTRILGTLAFGKEAMGMGDVHIMAAVGAVLGWKAASLTFFAAPLLGLLWAVYLLVARGRRELPYGPWLAAGALIVMLFQDGIVELIFRGR
jgi:leader peptidase (prepilin peptidase)/N-methyltransferase